MFIQRLILAVASTKFTFQIDSNEDDIIFTVIPTTTAPECEGAIAQAHAALAVPLRVAVSKADAVDESILADIQGYMKQRHSLHSNLDVVNKAVADATRAVKQESKEKNAPTCESKGNCEEKISDVQPSNQSRSLDL